MILAVVLQAVILALWTLLQKLISRQPQFSPRHKSFRRRVPLKTIREPARHTDVRTSPYGGRYTEDSSRGSRRWSDLDIGNRT